jgi:FkbM family methyltransferase
MKILKEIFPPILYKSIRYIRNKYGKRNDLPTWNRILGGPLEGGMIYVAPDQPAFKEMITGVYDAFFWKFLQPTNLESQTILDIGGHIGYHSMCFARLAGREGRVYVFEPNTFNLERMRLNFGKNEELSQTIHICPYALADFSGTTEFFFSPNVDDQTSSGGYIENSYKPLSESIYERSNFISKRVKVETLDNFARIEQINKLTLIKIDVEGAEHKILEGGKDTIANFRPLILAEIHSTSAMLYVCRVLCALNYELDILDEDQISRCFIAATPKRLAQQGAAPDRSPAMFPSGR